MVGEFNAAGLAEKKGMSQIGQAAHALIEPPPPVGVANTDCRKARVLRQTLRSFSLALLLPLILVLVACNEDIIPVDRSGQAPSISLRTPLEGASVGTADLLVEGSVSDTAAGVEVTVALDATYTVSASGDPDFSATIPAAELSLGAHTITAIAADADGLTATATVHITVVDATGDTTAPSIAITAPADDTTQVPGVIAISGTASDDIGLAAVEISIDEGAAVSVTGLERWTYSWDASSASLGAHTLVVTACDGASNESQAEISLTLSEADEAPGVINIVTQSQNLDEGAGSVTFVVERSGGTRGAVSVQWTTAQQTADYNVDYMGDNAVFNWADGEGGEKQATIPIVDDADIEDSEYFDFLIEHPQGGAALGNDTRISITINANDAQTTGATGNLTIYPATQAIQEQFESDRFAVRLSQNDSTQSSFVYQGDNDADPNWSGTLDYMQAANHWTTFSFDGSVDVEVSRLDGNTIRSCFVRPLSLTIQTRTEGNSCYFTLDHPVKVSVEIDEDTRVSGNFKQMGEITKQIVKHPLFVFADPLETSPPQAADPGVLYFGPGIHRIGKEYLLANNTQVYIAGGAYVIGTFISAQSNPSNIVIRGRGILSGVELTETADENKQWRNHAIDFSNGSRGSGLMIEGITITDPLRTCIISYSPVIIQHVKLFSWNHRNDGIVAGNNSLVEDSFIKVQDDNIKLYYSNQIIRRNVIWQQTSGGVFKFAWNLSGTAQDNQVSDIYLIHSDVFNDYAAGEEDRPDMHSTSAVFSAMGFKKGAAFQNNTFSRIRIEEENLLRLMSLRMVSSHLDPSGTTTWGDPDPTAGKLIDKLTFEDIQLAGVPYKQSTLYGNAGGTICNLSFVNLSVNGTQVARAAALSSRNDDIGLLTDGDVSNISFSP